MRAERLPQEYGAVCAPGCSSKLTVLCSECVTIGRLPRDPSPLSRKEMLMNPAADKPTAFTPPPSQAVAPRRHPLGLPAGSVRAILALMILGLIWTLVALQTTQDITTPIYLYYLMFLR